MDQAVADGGLEVGLDLVLDDEHHGLEARAAGVEDGIVDDELAVAAHRVDLLEAAVAAAHAGGHNNEYRFVHCVILLFAPILVSKAGAAQPL